MLRSMTDRTIVVAHGAWSAGWAWRRMRPRVAGTGATLLTPTYTGVGERSHLAHPEIGLGDHVEDMVQVLEFEDVHDAVLVGHSYGGMVATGLVSRCPERIAAVVYLDAFVPAAGQALVDLLPAGAADAMRAGADATGDGWRVPPNDLPPDTPAADVEWITPRRGPQPLRTFTEPSAAGAPVELPKAYVYCTVVGPGDVFGQFAARARHDDDWEYREIDASHSPHVTAPDALAELLAELATRLLG